MKDESELVAIVGATIIDGNGGAPMDNGIILVEGKRIVAVADRSMQVPRNARQISATGKYVIPGFMDAFVWLLGEAQMATTMVRYEGRYNELIVESAQIALKNGVTTVCDAWGPRDDLIKARDSINAGRTVGSRIYLSGNFIGLDGPFSDDFNPAARAHLFAPLASRINASFQHNVGQRLTSMSPEQVRQEIRKYAQSGVDYLSYAVSDHRMGVRRYLVFSPRVQRVIVEEAHRAGLPSAGFYLATGEAIQLAIESGADVLQIPDFSVDQPISDENVALIAERKVACTIELKTNKALECYRQDASNSRLLRLLEFMDRNHRALVSAGATLLLGTVSGTCSAENQMASAMNVAGETTGELGEGHFVWLRAIQEKGMKPMNALMAATRNVARAYRMDKDLGTLECGKLADLLILDRNPLENPENYRSINLVMKEGKSIDRAALPTKCLVTASAEANTTESRTSSKAAQ